MYILSSPARLAKLLTSIKVPYTDRPLSPIDVAKEIRTMLEDLGGDHNELVRRLPIEQDVTNQFLRLLNLPLQMREMVVWGESRHETGAIGFSVASKIASLNNHDDMLKVAGTITEMSRPVTKEEIKGILSLKKSDPNKPIDECMSEVLNVTRPVTITHYVFLGGLDMSISRSLDLCARKSGKSAHDLAADMLSTVFPTNSLKGVRVFSDCMRLSLTRQGQDFIYEYAKSHDVSIRNVLDHMLSSEGL